MARVAEVKRRFLSLSGCISIEKFLSGWFHGAPYEAIRRGNVEDFVAYGFYCRTVQNLPPQVGCHPYLHLPTLPFPIFPMVTCGDV